MISYSHRTANEQFSLCALTITGLTTQ